MPPPDMNPIIGSGSPPSPKRGGRPIAKLAHILRRHLWAGWSVLAALLILVGLVAFFLVRNDNPGRDQTAVSSGPKIPDLTLDNSSGSETTAKKGKPASSKKNKTQNASSSDTTTTGNNQPTSQSSSDPPSSSGSKTSTPPKKSGGSNNNGGSGSSGGASTDFCSKFPALPSSKPSTANTGVPAGTSLKNVSSISANTAGQVIEAVNVSGGITVNADNVTIKDSKITTTGYYGINIASGVTGTKILHNEIYTVSGGYTGISGNGNGETICGNYIHGWENGMSLTGGGMMIQANLIQKLESNQSGPHFDGIELYAGGNNQFWGNNIMMTDKAGDWLGETGAINVTGQYSDVDNTVIHGNWLGGGSYTLNLDDGQGYAVNGLTITDNYFYGSGPAGYATYGPARESSLATTWSGNVWTSSGQSVAK